MEKGLSDYPEDLHSVGECDAVTLTEKYISAMSECEKGENYEKKGNHEKQVYV